MLETLDAAAVRRWCGAGLAALRAHQHEIDELNVYPVPDGDTGTNLVLTLTSAHEAVEAYLTHAGEDTADPHAATPDAAATDGAAFTDGTAGTVGVAVTDGAAVTVGVAGTDGAAGTGMRRGTAEEDHPKTAGLPRTGAAETSAPRPDEEPNGPAKGATSLAKRDADQPDASGGGTPLGRVMRKMARGALLGARGNSGVIVSQILRGMADTFSTTVSARGTDLARALRTASEAAYAAVARPVEGTVLSVVAAAAEGAGRIKSDDLVTVARAAARSAAEALARTPQQLPVLARAGVVDAGGRGLVVLLDALVEALSSTDDALVEAPRRRDDALVEAPRSRDDALVEAPRSRDDALVEALSTTDPEAGAAPRTPDRQISAAAVSVPATEHDGYEYEVQYLLEADPAAVEKLKDTLDALGDSLVIVGTGEGAAPTWNVHVHVDDIGAAVEAGVVAGRPHRISVTRLEDRSHGHAPPAIAGSNDEVSEVAAPPAAADSRRGAVVVAAGDGLTSLFADEGAVVLGRNPSTAEILAAIEATGARQVVVLPNDANTHAVAMSAAREAVAEGRRVSVVPTRSPVQALAALAVRDPGRHFDDDVIAMAEASGACRYGEVTTAAREALTVAGRCRPGDLLGLVDGEVHVIGAGAGPAPEPGGEPASKAEAGAAPESGSSAAPEAGGSPAPEAGGSPAPEAGGGDGGPVVERGGSEDMAEVSRRLIDRMLGGGGELVTLVLGAAAPPDLEGVLRAHIARTWPFVEVQCYAGGQPRYHLLVGVE